MKNIIFAIVVFILLFLNNDFGFYLGVRRFSFLWFPLLAYCAWEFCTKGILVNKVSKAAMAVIIVALITIFLKSFFGQNYAWKILTFAIFPCVCILVFEGLSFTQYKILRTLVIIFFLFVCAVAVMERYTQQIFFESNPEAYNVIDKFENAWTFRASSVFVHPILSSMVVSCMSLFILLSDLKTVKKLMLFFMGFVAILCFNSRAGIMLITLLSLPVLYTMIRNESFERKLFYAPLVLALTIGLGWAIFNTDLGGRLIGFATEDGFLQDSSSLARLDTFIDFANVATETLLIGFEDIDWHDMLDLGILLENGYLAFFLAFGLVMGIPMLFALMRLHFYQLQCYSLWHRMLLFAVFYGFAFSSTHLAGSTVWVMFMFSYYAFRPYEKILLEREVNEEISC